MSSDRISDYHLIRFSDYLRAPFVLALLACAAACGGAFAQTAPRDVSQPASQSDSTTQDAESIPVQLGARGYVGAYLGDVNAERARQLGLKEIRGALVGIVEEGSPAANAGLRENDVILSFNDERVQNRDHFYRLLVNSQPGNAVSLEISRSGAEHSLEVVLGYRRSTSHDPCQNLFNEANAHLASSRESRKLAEEALQRRDEKAARHFFDEEKMFRQLAEESRAYIEGEIREGRIADCLPSRRPDSNPVTSRREFGVILVSLTEQLADFFKASKDSMLITEVKAGEIGERAGLKPGDCIVTVDGKTVKSTSDLDRLLDQESSGELEFVIIRDRNQRKVKIKVDQN